MNQLIPAFAEMNQRLQDLRDIGAQRIQENREVVDIMRARQFERDFAFYTANHDHLEGKALEMCLKQKKKIEEKYNL